ncbi:hypothetical protein ACFQAT_19740 [Undibacterium arcticum]|uniref:hypothetical protein n=1 Tax=Undibacterium arcticum TaxID=1762892 RepID=UPI00360F101B
MNIGVRAWKGILYVVNEGDHRLPPCNASRNCSPKRQPASDASNAREKQASSAALHMQNFREYMAKVHHYSTDSLRFKKYKE